MHDKHKPVPMTRPELAAKLCAWARSLTPEEKAEVRAFYSRPNTTLMTLDDLGIALRKWAQSLTPEQKAAVRNRLLAGVKS